MSDNALSFSRWWRYPETVIDQADNDIWICGRGNPMEWDPIEEHRRISWTPGDRAHEKRHDALYLRLASLANTLEQHGDDAFQESALAFARKYGLLGLPAVKATTVVVSDGDYLLVADNGDPIRLEEFHNQWRAEDPVPADFLHSRGQHKALRLVGYDSYALYSKHDFAATFRREPMSEWRRVAREMAVVVDSLAQYQSQYPESSDLILEASRMISGHMPEQAYEPELIHRLHESSLLELPALRAVQTASTMLRGVEPEWLVPHKWRFKFPSLLSALYTLLLLDFTAPSGDRTIKSCENCGRFMWLVSTGKYCSDECRYGSYGKQNRSALSVRQRAYRWYNRNRTLPEIAETVGVPLAQIEEWAKNWSRP